MAGNNPFWKFNPHTICDFNLELDALYKIIKVISLRFDHLLKGSSLDVKFVSARNTFRI